MSQASEVHSESASTEFAPRRCRYRVCTQKVQVQGVHSESAGTECALRKCRYREGGSLVTNFTLLQLLVTGNIDKRGPVVRVIRLGYDPVWTLEHDLVHGSVHDPVHDIVCNLFL